MTKKTTIRTLLLASGLTFGIAASGFAQGTGASVPAPGTDTGKGLLGQSYVSLAYGYTDLHQTSAHYSGLSFEYNQPLNTGFDFNLGIGDAWSSKYSGTRSRQQSVFPSAVAFIPDLSWGRPFIGVGAGWIWTKDASTRRNSFAYGMNTGVEFQVTKELSITPFVGYTDATSFDVNNKWDFGAKANYWITDQWAMNAGISRDNMVNTTYSVGTTFRF